jgi:hypothetical protein
VTWGTTFLTRIVLYPMSQYAFSLVKSVVWMCWGKWRSQVCCRRPKAATATGQV